MAPLLILRRVGCLGGGLFQIQTRASAFRPHDRFAFIKTRVTQFRRCEIFRGIRKNNLSVRTYRQKGPRSLVRTAQKEEMPAFFHPDHSISICRLPKVNGITRAEHLFIHASTPFNRGVARRRGSGPLSALSRTFTEQPAGGLGQAFHLVHDGPRREPFQENPAVGPRVKPGV